MNVINNNSALSDLNEIKAKDFFIRFVVFDLPPKDGLKRCRYYINIAGNPKKFYFGLSFNSIFKIDYLRKLVKNKSIIELIEPIKLKFDNELWLDSEGQLVMAHGAEPWNDKNYRIVGAPVELNKSRLLIDNELKGFDSFVISKFDKLKL